ncbi:MAG: carbohydrate ABC transporter permease [Bifidobacteriaceae bacterium]|jgi:multiple sugar transport system permease protein|nr:carbohydrate ABC transporter permease [Bifidobacteriaceae bacterium]
MTTKGSRGLKALVNLALLGGAALTSLPFFLMVFAAVKPAQEAMTASLNILPKRVTFQYLGELFGKLDFGVYLRNTMIIVLISFLGLMFMAADGYGFAKFRFKGRGVLFGLALATMMIPAQVTMIPTYLILNRLHLTGTLVGIALPGLVGGFGVFLFRQFMATIPDELLDAARMDGADEWRVFWSVVLPVSRPILAVQGVLTFIGSWNSFLWPLVIANNQSDYTLSVGLALLNDQVAVNPSIQMSGAAVMVVPILVVFVVFQRHIVQGFVMSGLKS